MDFSLQACAPTAGHDSTCAASSGARGKPLLDATNVRRRADASVEVVRPAELPRSGSLLGGAEPRVRLVGSVSHLAENVRCADTIAVDVCQRRLAPACGSRES